MGGANLVASTKLEKVQAEAPEPLRDCVRLAIEAYLEQLGGDSPTGLYRLVIDEVEAPLLETIMRHTGGNLSQSAAMLGINRGTLRKKLRQYDII